MKLDTEQVLQRRTAIVQGDAPRSNWSRASALIVAAIVAILIIYRETAASIVALWARSDTFAHGYIIVPIVLFLVWRKRSELARIAPRPDYGGFLLLALAGFFWLVAAAGQVQVLQQYAMTGMIPAAVVALGGRRAATAIAFPLAFLLLGVPFGEAFLPKLMDWTADFTIAALRLSGIPVYRDGNFFAIPSGQWSVVEACSGLRYLIASITVGALFAYLNYRRIWKRLLFMALSVAVPIGANFLRAYMIVMIGHLSDMKLAVGVDHFIYGWMFFGVVILLLFWLGSFWRDSAPHAGSDDMRQAPGRPATSAGMAAAALGIVAVASVWPLYAAHYLDASNGNRSAAALASPAGASGWVADAAGTMNWRPRYAGTVASTLQPYRKGDRAVVLYIGYYRDQRQGAELVNSRNGVEAAPTWTNTGTRILSEDLGDGRVELRQTHLRGKAHRLLVWEWFRIGDRDLSNPFLAKALLARDRLLGRGDDSAVIILAAPYEGSADVAAESLEQFGREMRPSIHAALAAVKAGNLQ
jgi:exosortase A